MTTTVDGSRPCPQHNIRSEQRDKVIPIQLVSVTFVLSFLAYHIALFHTVFMAIFDKAALESASPRVLVHKFLYKLREQQTGKRKGSTARTITTITEDGSGEASAPLETFLSDDVHIEHPLLLPPHHEQDTTSPSAAAAAAATSPSSENNENKNKSDFRPSEQALRLLQLQDSRTYFGSLEMALCDETQVIRHGYSHMPGFRGTVVQVFQLDAETRQRIVNISTRKTQVPWKQRWLATRKSWRTRRTLRQAWWQEVWGDDAPALDENAAAEEIAFQQRLVETNLFVFY